MVNELHKALDQLAIGSNFAIGNDLVFLPDFKLSFNPLLRDKTYNPNEIAYCEQFDDALLRYASTWAAKEAVYKAVKQLDPASPVGPKRITINRGKIAGRPEVTISGHENKYHISLTISHDGDYVWAIAMIEKR